MFKRLIVLCAISFGANASSISIVGQGMKDCTLTSSLGSDWVRVTEGWKYDTQLTVQCDENIGYHIITDTSSLASSELDVSEDVKLYIDDGEACDNNSEHGYSSSTDQVKTGTGNETWNVCVRFNGYDIKTLTGHVNVIFSNTSFSKSEPDHISYIYFDHDKKEPIGADIAVMDSMLQALDSSEEYVF